MSIQQSLPSQATPIADTSGRASVQFWRLVVSLFDRTGGTVGVDAAAVQATANAARPMSNSTFSGGIGVFGHTPPATQPAAPVTTADVIAIIRAYGLSA